jgi:protoheme IX farnesyltransferase
MILGKARISVVAMFTGYAAIAVEGSNSTHWETVCMCLLALFLLGLGANTLNQIVEKDKDASMERTKNKRPLPSGRMSARTALLVAAAEVFGMTAILALYHQSWLAVALALFTIFYYSVFYTMYLKPKHYLNIVIGGVPGSMGPLIAWAAMTNEVSWAAFLMFAIIFLWTPPHVWALAIKLKEDYAKAGIPMLPVVKGIDETTRQIFIYTLVMVAGSLLLPFLSSVFRYSYLYILFAVVLGLVFAVWAWLLWKRRPRMESMPLFHYSIVYISCLFLALVIDSFFSRGV